MITKNLVKLCTAMSEFEGWKPDGNFEARAKMPSVAYRNHNPGNLRSSPLALGVRDDFAFFLNDDIGMFAMLWDIMKKCKGETQHELSGDSSIGDMVSLYANVKDEALFNYLKYIFDRTGFDQYMQLKDIIK